MSKREMDADLTLVDPEGSQEIVRVTVDVGVDVYDSDPDATALAMLGASVLGAAKAKTG